MKNIVRTTLVIGLLLVAFQPARAMGQFFFLENNDVGKPIKDFTLKTLNGPKMSLAEFRGNTPTIVFFWATWCPHCRQELKGLNKRQAELAQKGIKVALVDVGEEDPPVQEYALRNKITMTIFLDADSAVSEDYGIIRVPTFYLVDAQGIIRDVEHVLPDDYETILRGSGTEGSPAK